MGGDVEANAGMRRFTHSAVSLDLDDQGDWGLGVTGDDSRFRNVVA
jgi:hypothetical protein